MKEIKVVIDSNILVSILKGSPSLSSIYAGFKEGRFRLVISAEILKELADVLYRPRLHIDPKDIRGLFRLMKKMAMRVKPRVRFPNVCRDPKDSFILEIGVEAGVDFIVTSDNDLLVLKAFHNIPIVKPKEFLSQLKK